MVNNIQYGDKSITDVYVGSHKALQIYFGTVCVYDTTRYVTGYVLGDPTTHYSSGSSLSVEEGNYAYVTADVYAKYDDGTSEVILGDVTCTLSKDTSSTYTDMNNHITLYDSSTKVKFNTSKNELFSGNLSMGISYSSGDITATASTTEALIILDNDPKTYYLSWKTPTGGKRTVNASSTSTSFTVYSYYSLASNSSSHTFVSMSSGNVTSDSSYVGTISESHNSTATTSTITVNFDANDTFDDRTYYITIRQVVNGTTVNTLTGTITHSGKVHGYYYQMNDVKVSYTPSTGLTYADSSYALIKGTLYKYDSAQDDALIDTTEVTLTPSASNDYISISDNKITLNSLNKWYSYSAMDIDVSWSYDTYSGVTSVSLNANEITYTLSSLQIVYSDDKGYLYGDNSATITGTLKMSNSSGDEKSETDYTFTPSVDSDYVAISGNTMTLSSSVISDRIRLDDESVPAYALYNSGNKTFAGNVIVHNKSASYSFALVTYNTGVTVDYDENVGSGNPINIEVRSYKIEDGVETSIPVTASASPSSGINIGTITETDTSNHYYTVPVYFTANNGSSISVYVISFTQTETYGTDEVTCTIQRNAYVATRKYPQNTKPYASIVANNITWEIYCYEKYSGTYMWYVTCGSLPAAGKEELNVKITWNYGLSTQHSFSDTLEIGTGDMINIDEGTFYGSVIETNSYSDARITEFSEA